MAGHVRSDDVRQLLRLVAECREIRDAGARACAHFLGGLARLTRSQVVIRMDAGGVARGASPIIRSCDDFGWPNDSDRNRVYEYVAHTPVDADPLTASILAREESVVTSTRANAVASTDWHRAELRNEIHRPSGIDESLLSIHRKAEPGEVRVLAFKRGWGEEAYDEEERELVDLAHGEYTWLFDEAPTTTTCTADWSPRERETLALLLTGASEKCIAARLSLSRHTVHDYVKSIYRKRGVSSRAELMAGALAQPALLG